LYRSVVASSAHPVFTSIKGQSMNSWHDDLPALQQCLTGPSFVTDTPGYAKEVAVFNEVVRHRPAIVVGAAHATDVSEAVRFASRHGMSVAVLNTGHGPSVAAGPDTLMITVRRMSGIDVDSANSTARVQAGVLFGQLVEEAAHYGLAPLAGSSPGVGVVGYTLGGGASFTMGRKHGWAADHVSAIDVVTPDGELRRITAQSDPDLFGAVLGGKSNFGVVTAMESALFPVTHLYAGALFYSGDHAREVLNAYRLFTQTAPEDITSTVALLNFPPLPFLPPFMRGKLTVSVRVSHVGDAATGSALIEPLRRAAPLLMDTVDEIPFTQFASIAADPTDPAAAVEHFGLLRELTEEAVDAIVDVAGPAANSTINIVDIRQLGGAYSRPPVFTNAVGARDASYAYFALAVVPPGLDIADFRDVGNDLVAALAPWRFATNHPSFQGPADATVEGTRHAFVPDVYDRLQAVKAKFDPDNVFRVNHNIPPTGSN
jgi:FAD binding domain-containing protein/berberine-like enzyme